MMADPAGSVDRPDTGDPERWNRQADLAGGVFVVTGATQGIGAAIALRLAARGAGGIVISGRDTERGAAMADRLR